jgi:hypothetical protein
MFAHCVERNAFDWALIFEFGLKLMDNDPSSLEELNQARKALLSVDFPNELHNSAGAIETMIILECQLRKLINPHALAFIKGPDSKLDKNIRRLTYLNELKSSVFFREEWGKSGFARIELGHKLSAALCLTDVPSSVPSPWDHWSLVVPAGMFETTIVVGNDPVLKTAIERIWCKGSEIQFIVYAVNKSGFVDDESLNKYRHLLGSVCIQEFSGVEFMDGSKFRQTLVNLARGVCLCVTDKSQERKGKWGHAQSERLSKKFPSLENISGEKYVIGKPIEIDLRKDLEEYLHNESNGKESPRFQFLVRGHWRNQRFGPGRTQSRPQWIHPFWKGKEEMRVLLRPYEIKSEESPTKE